MDKSLYSLILSDEVISKIDTLAYAMRTSRSNYINEVLAGHVSYITPSQRIKDILEEAKAFLEPEGRYAFVEMSSNSYMDIRSALNYRYRPTIRYCIEMTGQAQGPFCRLKAQVRTQSKDLIIYIERFFMIWQAVEDKLMSDKSENMGLASYDNVCYTRSFFLKDMDYIMSESGIGEAIAAYIVTLDNAINAYMDNIGDDKKIASDIYNIYMDYFNSSNLII